MPTTPLTTRRINQSLPGLTVIEFTDAEGDREWRAALAKQAAAEMLQRARRPAASASRPMTWGPV